MEIVLSLRWIIITAILSYFPLLIAANVLQLKVNYIVAGTAIFLSLYYFVKRRRNFILLTLMFFLICIKVLLLGGFGVKSLVIVICGPLLFECFSNSFNGLNNKDKNFIFKSIMLIGGFISLVIALQRFGVFPHQIGAMRFLSVVGYDITGEYVGGVRPTAFFYHPYDTALSILPVLTFLMLSYCFNRYVYILGCAVSLFVTYSLGLKVLYLYVFLVFVVFHLRLHRYAGPVVVYIVYFLLMAGTLILSSNDYVSEIVGYTAGRLYIWNIMVEHFLYEFSFIDFLFGYNQDILSISFRWEGDESYTPHNQYLYSLLYLGFVFTAIFLYLLWRVVCISKFLSILVIVMCVTFAVTGDLFIFFAFWVCLAQLHVIVWKVGQLNRRDVLVSGKLHV